MRLLAQSFPMSLRRGPLFAVGFFVFAMIIAYELAGYIINDDVTSLAFVAMAFVGGAIILAILHNWQNGVYFFLAWLLFEDLARKFLGNNMAIYFAKDFLLAIVYMSFFIAYRRKEKDLEVLRPPFLMALVVFVWFGVMQIFNPGSTSIFFGILGMKLYFYYAPLFVIGYSLIDSEVALRRFFNINLGIMLAQEGKVEEARAALRQALAQEPDLKSARAVLARLEYPPPEAARSADAKATRLVINGLE